jgi:lysophospholipase L1-like esterase
MRRHALWIAGLAVVVAAAAGVALAGQSANWHGDGVPIGQASTAACPPADRRPGPPPTWARARRATILVDSVLLGGVPALREELRGWRTASLGRPAIMLPAAEQQIRAGGRVAPLAIVGVGYNSLWERGRRNYATWAAAFDRQARALVRALRARGARQVVWVTLREAGRGVIPSGALWQFDAYAWYFPYVNERLRRLDRARDDLVLAEWDRVSKRTGVTYDAIHLNPRGASLMARTIHAAIDGAADDQRPPPRCRPAPATARS